jgi:outer membrane protein OmpA-like peptidoglycan-associated protein
MRHPITLLALTLIACGGGNPPAASSAEAANADATSASAPPSAGETASGDSPGETPESAKKPGDQFTMLDTKTAKDTQGTKPSTLKPTKTEALMKFVVVHKEKGPIEGIVIAMSAPDGKKYYTEETDAAGYAEVLVPVGKKYEIVYVSLGRKDITATYDVTNEPNQKIKLTLRYTRYVPEAKEPERFVLDGVNFDTAKATIKPESFPRLDRIVEFMSLKKKTRIQIAGHTDNAGNKKSNKTLSQNRARACRDYLISKGIEASRIEAVGYGDERPIEPNDSEEGRAKNRRIEAWELQQPQ